LISSPLDVSVPIQKKTIHHSISCWLFSCTIFLTHIKNIEYQQITVVTCLIWQTHWGYYYGKIWETRAIEYCYISFEIIKNIVLDLMVKFTSKVNIVQNDLSFSNTGCLESCSITAWQDNHKVWCVCNFQMHLNLINHVKV